MAIKIIFFRAPRQQFQSGTNEEHVAHGCN